VNIEERAPDTPLHELNALAHEVARAALGWRNWMIAFSQNARQKGAQHKDTKWTRGKVASARKGLERAIDAYVDCYADKDSGQLGKEVLDVKEAAAFLGFAPYTIREKARLGEIPGRKTGKEWRFSRRQLLAFLEGFEGADRGAQKEATT
jgi:excisionase family DNA binding protein